MADTNLNTSISAVATRILNAVATANADELTKLASAALFVGESENELIETAINTRVNTLITNADADTVRKLASAIKKMKTAPQSDIVTGGVGDISELTDTQGLLNAGGTSIDISDTAPTSPSAGDLWFDSTELTTYVYYDDGSSSQWVNITPTTSGGGSSSGSVGITVYATVADLPLADNETGAQAFVSGNNRLYLWNGSGWYNIALINTNPTITNISGTGILDGVCTLDDATLTPTVITITAADPEGLILTFSATTDTNFDGLATISQVDNVFTVTPKDQATATTTSGSVTFTANDGVNIGTDVLQFTLEFTSGNFKFMTGYVVSGQQDSANYSTTQTATQAAYPSNTVYYGIVPWEANASNATNTTATNGAITDWRENNGSTGALGYNYDGGFDISSCGRYGVVSGWTSTNSSAIGIFDRANIDAWHNYAAASANTTSRGSISIGTLRGGAGSAGLAEMPSLPGWPRFNADGTKLWCGDNCIIEITMNTPYSLSGTLNVDYTVKKYHPNGQSFSNYIGTFITLGSADGTDPTGVSQYTQSSDETVWTFSLDGTKLYWGQRNVGILQYALGTPYDLDTASFEHHVNTFTDIKTSTNYTLANAIGYSMRWMADGHTFVLGQGGGGTTTRRDVYHVTTPWDISTISQRGDGYTYASGTYFDVDPFTNAHILVPTNSDGVFYQDTAASDLDLGTKIDPRDWPRVPTYSGNAPNASMTAFDLNEDGTKLYWTGSSYDTIYQATLSTPYDTSTAYDVDQLPDNTTTNILSMKIKNDGQYLYVADQISKIYRLTLPTPYDITSHSTYTDPNGFQGSTSADVGQVYTIPVGDAISMEFNDTGTRIFYVKNGNDTSIYWVDLSTPWDLTTVGSENSIDILSFGSSTNYYPYSALSLSLNLKFAFYNNGSKLYVTTSHAAGIGYVFELATPWDMNTATLIPLETVNNFRGLTAGAGGNNVHINNAGSKLVTACHNNSGIKTLEFKKYDPSPWPIKYLQT